MTVPAANQSTQIAVDDPMISMIERAARDPAIDINKLERLIVLQEKVQERAAEQAFNSAMSDAQGEMTSVAVDSNNPQTRSRYASYFALDKALRPIYSKHGFALSFGTGEIPQESYVRVLCYASHRAGFTRTYHIDMPADGKGAKGGDVMTKTHATGSAMSYGQRYLLKMIFNISVGSDDDGNAASPAARSPVPSPPEPIQEPRLIKGGRDATEWAKMYTDAVLKTSDNPAVVFQWVDANADPLARLGKASPEILAEVRTAVEKHLAFLRKTEKPDPISSGLPPKTAKGEMPNIEADYTGWIGYMIKRIAVTDAGDAMDALFDIINAESGLFPPDREAIDAARQAREDEQAP